MIRAMFFGFLLCGFHHAQVGYSCESFLRPKKIEDLNNKIVLLPGGLLGNFPDETREDVMQISSITEPQIDGDIDSYCTEQEEKTYLSRQSELFNSLYWVAYIKTVSNRTSLTVLITDPNDNPADLLQIDQDILLKKAIFPNLNQINVITDMVQSGKNLGLGLKGPYANSFRDYLGIEPQEDFPDTFTLDPFLEKIEKTSIKKSSRWISFFALFGIFASCSQAEEDDDGRSESLDSLNQENRLEVLDEPWWAGETPE